ncbi:NAD(P)H-hydrate dehydratase [Azovibrio restrictus]|uniref:NAD(P)H-hydrate dehydratase n=1 Tax=Azovibrio restrictus TaxID=146938 RepID=UPI0026EE4DFA|nr:NAD(P)H-hydrate dehydratase [Azovibrio restrictus]
MDTRPSTSLYFSASLRQIEAAHARDKLMGRAGAAAADWARQLLAGKPAPVLVLAGPGNNGGDALEMAAELRRQGIAVQLVFKGRAENLPADARQAHARFIEQGGSCLEQIPPGTEFGLIVDGLFGIGLTRPLEGEYAELVRAANKLARHLRCPLLALDCPSGLDADSGFCRGVAIQASHTLSFIAGKPGLYTADGPDCCGEIRIHDLGLGGTLQQVADGALVQPEDFRHCLQPRRRNSHKGSHGSVGIIGGAHSMIGAPLLAGRAALKLGAGRVFLGLLDPQAPGVDFVQPELMLRKPEGIFDAELTALACGPGLGRSVHAAELLERALATHVPLVLDADALNILAFEEGLQAAICKRRAPVLLTPHPAEAARLLDLAAADIQQDRIHMAQALARRYRAWVALKGCGTVIADPEGCWWINTSGNPGLASAGSGDVLTGLLAALLGQGWPITEALLAACHLHGQAADQLVREGIGPVGMCAGEIADAARQCLNQWLAAAS